MLLQAQSGCTGTATQSQNDISWKLVVSTPLRPFHNRENPRYMVQVAGSSGRHRKSRPRWIWSSDRPALASRYTHHAISVVPKV
jgi:hypothetical protein